MELDKKLLKSLTMMAAVVEARDAYTGGHLWRVSQFARLLGLRLGLPEAETFRVGLCGFLHDLGKVGVPDAILNKPDKLTDLEYAAIKTHPAIGADLIGEHPLSDLAHDAIRHHHEWYAGGGYPDGLRAEEITLHSRIVGLVDAFDAMTSTRPYRKGMPVEKAFTILIQERDRQFDGRLVDAFVSIDRREGLDHIVGHSDEGQPLASCPMCGPILALPRGTTDGALAFCRVCSGELRLNRAGDGFEAEITGRVGQPEQLKPQADLGPIDDFVRRAPIRVSI